MNSYSKKYKGCVDFLKKDCDIYNARFHYIDTREPSYFPQIIHRYLKNSPSMFRLYAIVSRPNYYQDIKQYYLDIISGNDMDKNPIHQIETFEVTPSQLNLPNIKSNVVDYLNKAIGYTKRHGIFDFIVPHYISDFKYLIKKIQRQFRNCEPEFVEYVKQGISNYLDSNQASICKTLDIYKKQIENIFDVMIPGNHNSYTPPSIIDKTYLLLHIILQDLYAIGRMFRVKWSKPHVYGTNHVLYTGALHSMSTYKLLEFVPQIKVKVISHQYVYNCSKMVPASDHSDIKEALEDIWTRMTAVDGVLRK